MLSNKQNKMGEGSNAPRFRSTWFHKHEEALNAIAFSVGDMDTAIEVFQALKRKGFKIVRAAKRSQ